MNENIRGDGAAGSDPLESIPIDERFRASGPSDKTVAAGSNPHLSKTVSTPHHLKPVEAEMIDDSPNDPLIGQTIGNYEVLSELGRGGFGAVYKAKDKKLQRFAALKFLRFPLDGEFRKMFENEAQVIANLGKHPSIVQIYSWGEHQGSQYFALEFLDTSVESQIKKRDEPLSVKQALEIIADCAGALHFAHQQGVLHRDIKPANILIDSKTGRAKVCDFGLAKFNALATGTDTQTIAGSPPYMAPEQIVGKSLDARTDVYSLGVTLYEMLSREVPCKGASQIEIMDKIRSRKSTPLRQYRPDLSDSILDIVKRATAFGPEDRFQSAEEMQGAAMSVLRNLDKSGSADNLSVKSASMARRRPRMLLAAAAAFILIVAGSFALRGLFSSNESTASLWPQAVAAAKEQIDAGKYDEAITWLEAYVKDNETDDFAHYALGYARLLSNRVTEAEDAFDKVADAGLRDEGLAAVEYTKLGEESRSSLQTAASQVPSAYPAVMLASLDILNNQHDKAIKQLEAIDQSAFNFDWQRKRYGEVMARAYYKNGDYKKAEQILGAEKGGSDSMSADVNALYATMAKRQLDDGRRASVAQQIESIKSLAAEIKAGGGAAASADADNWTSRPFRVRISPASVNNCRAAEESGLAEVFADLMAGALVDNDQVPIELVDRDYIGDVLYEQQLAELSKDVDRVKLQNLLGARLMIESEFKSLMDENTVWVKIIDTETTKFTKVESKAFDRRTNAREWARTIGVAATDAIKKAYPVQGIVTNGTNGAEINVGSNVGVRPGMKFAVFTAPGIEYKLANVTAVASSTVKDSSAGVTLEPAGTTIPEKGWYLQQIQE